MANLDFTRELSAIQEKLHAEGKYSGTYLAITCVRLGKSRKPLQLLREDFEKHDVRFFMSRDNFDLRRGTGDRPPTRVLSNPE